MTKCVKVMYEKKPGIPSIRKMPKTPKTCESSGEIISKKRLAHDIDFSFIDEIADKVLAKNNEVPEKCVAGKKKLFDFSARQGLKK